MGIMTENPDPSIRVGEILEKKTGKHFPRFVVRWIEKFIHQDFINGFLEKGYEGVEFCTECIKYLDLKLDVSGLDTLEIPPGARLTYASNHPLGGADGIALIGLIGAAKQRPVKLLVNDFLMNIKGLASMCVPVNKLGGQSRNLPAMVKEIYEGDNDVLIFPSGKCSRLIDGKVQDPAWAKSFVKMSVESGRWIVPVHFIGQNSGKFYRVTSLFSSLGLKFNIGMALLPDELYKARHKSFRIVFGKPVPPTRFDSSKSYQQWAGTIREEAYNLL